jgi:hypothetical protein
MTPPSHGGNRGSNPRSGTYETRLPGGFRRSRGTRGPPCGPVLSGHLRRAAMLEGDVDAHRRIRRPSTPGQIRLLVPDPRAPLRERSCRSVTVPFAVACAHEHLHPEREQDSREHECGVAEATPPGGVQRHPGGTVPAQTGTTGPELIYRPRSERAFGLSGVPVGRRKALGPVETAAASRRFFVARSATRPYCASQKRCARN